MSEQMDFEDGKYTVIYDEGHFKALRYGQPWRDLTGDNLVYAMLVKASQLKKERDALAAKLKELEGQEPVAWVGHGPRDGRVEFSISKPVPSVFRDFGFKPLFARPVPAEPALAVWFGSMPESNGKTNWTAILHRCGEEPWKGITIDRSEYKDRVRYEADRLRWLIGELDQEPDILVYDEDLTEQVPAESVNARLLDLVKRFQDYMHGPTAWNQDQEDELSQEISAAIAEAQQAEAAAGLTRTDREAVPA